MEMNSLQTTKFAREMTLPCDSCTRGLVKKGKEPPDSITRAFQKDALSLFLNGNTLPSFNAVPPPNFRQQRL